MHFFYLDESGDTGADFTAAHQPIFVLAGISVRDEGWNQTQKELQQILHEYFGAPPATGFELHADDLLSPNGEGAFAGHTMDRRCALCLRLLDLLHTRAHDVHYFAVDKRHMATATAPATHAALAARPYLLSFDYLITYINWFVKERLGTSARAMIILDWKEENHAEIERIMRARRFEGPAAHRVKWIVEFSYAVDSKKNPMIQLSDLVAYCIKRFIELDLGLRDNWPREAKNHYRDCYAKISDRIARSTLVEREGRGLDDLNSYLLSVRATPRVQWRRHHQNH
jgi:hypothetical protein